MARGQQKIQSQQRNAKEAQKRAKGTDNKKAAQAALTFVCAVCKVREKNDHWSSPMLIV